MTKQHESPKPTTPMPPAPPVGKPFQIGATKAIVNAQKGGDRETVTLRLSRVIKASPEKIYKAFLDPDARAAWLPPNGFMARTHSMDARVGGTYRMSFYTANKSWEQSFGGKFVELVPYTRIVHTDRFETNDPAMQGEMTVTIKLTKIPEGNGESSRREDASQRVWTLLEIEQAGIPAGPATAGAPYGWAQSLDKLAQLVEPELPF